MKKRLSNVSITLSLVAVLSLIGCGSSSTTPDSSSADQNQPQELTGTVATGLGASSDISFVGAQGNTLNGRSVESGEYSVDASSLTQPIMVRAILDRDGSILYSFAESTTGVVNVTPLTSFIVDQAAQAAGVSGGSAQLFQNYVSADRSTLATEIHTQTADLDAVIDTQMSEDNVGDFDHFSGEFNADHTGYDALLDNLDIVVYNDDIIIREGNTTLDTLNYDISIEEINATGLVYNAIDGSYMSDVNITFQSNTDQNKSVMTDSNGAFTLPIDTMRTYTVTATAAGYETQVLPNISSFAFTQENLGSIPMFPTGVDTNTTLSGTVIDGRTANAALENVTITFRDGYDNRISDVVETVSTDANGSYSTILGSGVYTAELTLDGYGRIYRNVEVFGDTLTWDTSMLAQSIDAVEGAFATISLNWDANPRDLDSHLTGPSSSDSNSSRFHMYYGNMHILSGTNAIGNEDEAMSAAEQAEIEYARIQLENISGENLSSLSSNEIRAYYNDNLTQDQQADMNRRMEEYENSLTPTTTSICADGAIASLDRDRTSDYEGLLPETTTLCDVSAGGMYKYYVHEFSGTETMSEGHATVTVTTASGVTNTFTAPTTGESGYHDIWHVFDIDADGNIYPVNEITGNGSDESSLFAAPSRINNANKPFQTEKGLFNNLPTK